MQDELAVELKEVRKALEKNDRERVHLHNKLYELNRLCKHEGEHDVQILAHTYEGGSAKFVPICAICGNPINDYPVEPPLTLQELVIKFPELIDKAVSKIKEAERELRKAELAFYGN
ncbi:hypothetical protein [Proteus phage VTCCBPA139]|nr:hypothetical protein [Proteus phage VTCCBPA139]